jgi:hypothetical protein
MAELQLNDEYGLVDVPVPQQPVIEKSIKAFRPFGKFFFQITPIIGCFSYALEFLGQNSG